MKNHTERGASNPLVLFVLAALLALSSLALARPMYPYENGEGWIADKCRSAADKRACCDDNCNYIYPGDGNVGAYYDCRRSCREALGVNP